METRPVLLPDGGVEDNTKGGVVWLERVVLDWFYFVFYSQLFLAPFSTLIVPFCPSGALIVPFCPSGPSSALLPICALPVPFQCPSSALLVPF
ncbi:unnamed protein product [Boreogadus saida]